MLLNSVEQSKPVSAAALIRGAQVALETDLDAARECLRLLDEMLHTAPDGGVSRPPETPPAAGTIRGGLAAWQIRVVTNHIDRNLDRTIGIGELAALARLSKGHFCRAFKVSLGETARTYITRRRIAQAQMLMVTTSETLSAIANACGLADQAHLTRLFRRFVDQTPLVWRRKWQRAR
jgi:AraC-like DNA-binding protein